MCVVEKFQLLFCSRKIKLYLPCLGASDASSSATSATGGSAFGSGVKRLPAEFQAKVAEIVNGAAVRIEYGGAQVITFIYRCIRCESLLYISVKFVVLSLYLKQKKID